MEDRWYQEFDYAISRRDVAGGQALLDRAEAKAAAENTDLADDGQYQALADRWANMLEGTCKVCGKEITQDHPHQAVPYLGDRGVSTS